MIRDYNGARWDAIDKVFNGSDAYWFENFTPNMRVYRMMLEAIAKLNGT